MSKMLKFGGPRLPVGTHSFYQLQTPEGPGAEIKAEIGHEVEFDKVHNAQKFVDGGVATIVNVKAGPVST